MIRADEVLICATTTDFRQTSVVTADETNAHGLARVDPVRMTIELLVALLVFLFPLAYSPGPGNAFFAALGASGGLKGALPALAGYHLATLLVTLLIGWGLGGSILEDPVAAKTLAAAGSLYVLWLAWGFIRSARAELGAPRGTPAPHSVGFWSGAFVLVLNPKAYYIIAVMFAQFLRPPAHSDLAAVLTIAVVFTVNNLVAFIIWALGGRALALAFRGERARQVINYLFASTLIAVAIWMVVPLFR